MGDDGGVNEKRKRMGIEPTGRAFVARPNGFEDRGPHQRCMRFRDLIFAIGGRYFYGFPRVGRAFWSIGASVLLIGLCRVAAQ